MTQIDGHVPDTPIEAPHPLRLGPWRALEVQASDGANGSRQRVIDLDDRPIGVGRRQFLRTEQASKLSTLIPDNRAFRLIHTWQRSLEQLHSLNSGAVAFS